ncbi:MAG: class I SAM-dependent methyltransferase [Chloroflexota bacterium]
MIEIMIHASILPQQQHCLQICPGDRYDVRGRYSPGGRRPPRPVLSRIGSASENWGWASGATIREMRKETIVSKQFDKAYWEEHYRGRHSAGCQKRPNPQLVIEAGDLAPGTALDAGCGEGADAIWLALRGWRVTAVDISSTALRRGREYSEALGADTESRIDWVQADLTSWRPSEEHFDLVAAHHVHTTAPREELVRRLAAAVAPGGTLLIVGHHPSDLPTDISHVSPAEAFFTAEEVVASLDPVRWEIAVAEARTQSATGHDGHEITMRDTVLRARKRS